MVLSISNIINSSPPRTPKRCRSHLDEDFKDAKRLRSSLSKTLKVVHHDLPSRASRSLRLQRMFDEQIRSKPDRFVADIDENALPIKMTPRSLRFADKLSSFDDRQIISTVHRVKGHTALHVTDYMQNIQRDLTKRLYDHPFPASTTSAQTNLKKDPEKVLDAPNMKDDFYAHPVSWSSKNVLAIQTSLAVVYCDMSTGQMEYFKDVAVADQSIHLEWSPDNTNLAFTDSRKGKVSILDTLSNRRASSFHCCLDDNCDEYIGAINWRDDNILTVAYSDGTIRNHDRRACAAAGTLQAHKSRICGIRWSPDGRFLASGDGNGNVSCWDYRTSKSFIFGTDQETKLVQKWKIRKHMSTVKAMSWCPWQADILATGGGRQDSTIRIWSITTGSQLYMHDSKKQVTSLHFAPHCREIVTTYGYCHPSVNSKPTHAVLVHDYPSFRETGRINVSCIMNRVPHSCFNPDGTRLLTFCSDETLKIFKIFGEQKTMYTDYGDMRRQSIIR